MVVVPRGSKAVLALVAEPAVRLTALPKATPLVLNCTVPVGVPEPEVTVALKLMLSRYADGLCEEDKAVDVAAVTTNLITPTVLSSMVAVPAAAPLAMVTVELNV